MYRVYEMVGNDVILRMRTDDKRQAEGYYYFAKAHHRTVWMKVQK